MHASPSSGLVSNFPTATAQTSGSTQEQDLLLHLRRAVEQSPVSIVITDAAGTIQFVNPKFEAVSGYSAAEAIGQNPRILKSGHQSEEFYRQMWQTLSSGQVWSGDFRNRRRDGSLYWECARISPMRDAEGRTTHYIAVKEDITAAKEAEEALRHRTEELVLANEKLRATMVRAQALAAEAEAANRAKDAFVAAVSHELRTPLSVINGLAAVLAEAPRPEADAQAISLIQESGQSLLALINDLLDYSALQVGKARLESSVFSLRELLGKALDYAAPAARRKGLHLDARVTPGAPARLVGDPDRIRQILTNLLSNAAKYTARGCVRLAVRVLPEGEDRAVLQCTVFDSGVGIGPGDRARLFQAFERPIRSDGVETVSGTGLGLAVCKSLAQLMAGDIRCKSKPGTGSAFRFRLRIGLPRPPGSIADELPPRRAGEKRHCLLPGERAAPRPASVPTPRAPAPATPTGKPRLGDRLPLRLLVVDDLPTNRRMLCHMLRHMGYEAATACDGAEALAKVQEQAYDAVLLDVQMPVMDGITATHRIRALDTKTFRQPRIIAITANALTGDRERCLSAGMDDYLPKPIMVGHLETCFTRWFKDRLRPEESPALPSPAPVPPPDLPPAEPSLLDRSHLTRAFPGVSAAQLADILGQMQASAEGDYRDTRDKLFSAAARRDGPALLEAVHGLKGCFALLGWSRLAALCAEAVAELRAGRFSRWDELPGAIDSLFAPSSEELRRFRESLPARAPTP